MQQRNDLLIYTIETIIDKGNARASNLTKIHVYKLLYLAYLDLKKQNINIKLPYSWYLYGTMVESQSFTRQTGVALGGYFLENNRAVNTYCLSSTISLSSSTQYAIEHTVDTLIDKYEINNRLILDNLLKDIYAIAPTEFQRIYKYELMKNNLNDTNRTNLLSTLDTLTKSFPHEKYDDVFPRYLRWEELLRLAIELKANKTEIKDLIEIYWNYFAAVLRTRENENITPAELGNMQNLAEKDTEIFDIKTFDYEEKYTLQLPPVDITTLPKEGRELLKEISNVAYNAYLFER